MDKLKSEEEKREFNEEINKILQETKTYSN